MLHSIRTLRKNLAVAALGIGTSLIAVSPAARAADCSASQWQAPADTGGTGVQALLKVIPPGTKWSELPVATKAELQRHADNRLVAFRARWGAEALKQKETILLDCPSAAMSAALDDFYVKSYAVLGGKFALAEIKNTAFRRVLVSAYLGSLAAFRATLTYPGQKFPNRDWDGESLFDSTRLPDRQANAEIRAFHARIVAELRAIGDASLSDREKALKQEVLLDARAVSAGAISGDSFGGRDLESVCELIVLNGDVVQGYKADKGRPRIFADDDAVLREVNAMYLHGTALKGLDAGTLAAALSPAMLCRGTDDDLEEFVTPSSAEVAKGIVQLRDWWIERLALHPDARNKCTIYSAADRVEIWEAFSADQRSNNDGATSMDTYKAQIDRYRESMIKKYRGIARLAVQQVFPDESVLTAAQRLQVLAAIDAEMGFARYPAQIAVALDTAQGKTNGPASSLWQEALAKNVVYFQGNYGENEPVRPEDESAIRAMFDEVKKWVGERYKGYPIDIAGQFGKFTFTVTTEGNAATRTSNGNIRFGVGARRSRMEYYSILLHELRHAVAYAHRATAPNPAEVVVDIGPVIEGSGVAVEDLLLEAFLRQLWNSDLVYALSALDYGLRDARFVATTDAALSRYFRSSCSDPAEPDGLAYAKAIVLGYGLPDALAANQALRAHVGTQYFQYIAGGRQVIDDIAWLQAEMDAAGGKVRLDPFVLFACQLNNPSRDASYLGALRACLKL